ncbi:MAG: HNH endonuclease [Candidatus Microsaccharimonas sossegonensis]|uniref:HNH endonuclease n=1 Tax=Candidatus Microsaccharimonas sossegonensis TaxID=2506948 RepID=A0A4Q0AIA7_9BACT|nr:MAG: HNH endonuclease [Candidatus Microsaccharimonas sossegonensis]
MRLRRSVVSILSLVGFAVVILAAAPPVIEQTNKTQTRPVAISPSGSAAKALDALVVKGRAPKTGYTRTQFGSGWGTTNGCDTRNIILYRDLENPVVNGSCVVVAGVLHDPYTATDINFTKGGSDVQIDHVVALSNAWQTGAQNLTKAQRVQLANDPLELLAVQGDANQQKGDGDAATWLPANKSFRCEYAARQIAIKQKYTLWVTDAEKRAMLTILSSCPNQVLPSK